MRPTKPGTNSVISLQTGIRGITLYACKAQDLLLTGCRIKSGVMVSGSIPKLHLWVEFTNDNNTLVNWQGYQDGGLLLMKTALLLGAGSSVAADFPSTEELTKLVLSGDGVVRHTDSSYYLKDPDPDSSGPQENTTSLANAMVRRLHAEAKNYHSVSTGMRTSYEDIFYLAEQVRDDLSGEMENPAIRQFLNDLRQFLNDLKTDMLPLIEKAGNSSYENLNSLLYLLDETCHYIADIVWGKLCHKPGPGAVKHLNAIANACASDDITGIATLCHDTHVERFLKEKGVALVDGFSKVQEDVRYWDGDFASDSRIPFMKLHGSINWFRFRPDQGDWYDEGIGIPLDDKCDYWHTRTEKGDLQTPLDGRPLLLIGTFNKIQDYSSGIFREIHFRFRSILNETDQMIICGYSFGDKGINSEITDWFYKKRERRITVIHKNPDDLAANARGAIRNKWSEWKESGLLSFIEKRFEEVSETDLMSIIDT